MVFLTVQSKYIALRQKEKNILNTTFLLVAQDYARARSLREQQSYARHYVEIRRLSVTYDGLAKISLFLASEIGPALKTLSDDY